MNRIKSVILITGLFATGLLLAAHLARENPDGWRPTSQQKGAPAPDYHRICCLSPALTECLFALDAGDRIVGVSDFATWPPQALEIQTLGGYINPNFDLLITLQPDLVIYQDRPDKVEAFCRQHHIATLPIDRLDTIQDIFDAITTLGQTLNRQQQADQRVRSMQQQLADIKRRAANQPRPRVLLCMFRRPGSFSALTTIGEGSFLHELIALAGGENLFDDLGQLYPQIAKEAVLLAAPEVIIEAQPAERLTDQNRRRLLEDWQIFSSLPAVQNQRIYFVAETDLFLPGPRLTDVARKIADLIHPGITNE